MSASLDKLRRILDAEATHWSHLPAVRRGKSTIRKKIKDFQSLVLTLQDHLADDRPDLFITRFKYHRLTVDDVHKCFRKTKDRTLGEADRLRHYASDLLVDACAFVLAAYDDRDTQRLCAISMMSEHTAERCINQALQIRRAGRAADARA